MGDHTLGSPPEDGPGEAIDRPTAAEAEPGMLKSSAVMAVGTILSRVTGLARDIAMVAAIGFGTLADAYSLGNTLPNIIYILIVGGALNAVFVPQLVRHLTDDADRGDGYANRLLTLTGLILLGLSVVSVLAAPWIVRLYAPSNYSQEDLDVAIAFARFCLPQIFFYGMYTMLSQVLNSRGHFAMPMFAPIVNNILVIGMAVGFIFVVGDVATINSITTAQITWLGVGTTLGVVLQALVLVPVLGRVGYRFRPKFNYRGYGLTKTGVLAGWTIGLVLVNQIGFVVTTRLATAANVNASTLGVVEQGLTTYQKAYLVFMLPQSVITVSLVTALLPRLSRSASHHRIDEVSAGLANGARLISALIIPAAAVLVVFGAVITSLVFNVGAGSGAAATYTGIVVSAFALGLLPFALFYLLLRGWYSLEDTRTPFFATIIFNVILMAFTLPMYYAAGAAWKITSLALAYSAAYWVTLFITWWLLATKLGGLHTRTTSSAIGRMLLAGVAAGGLGFLAMQGLRMAYTANTGVALDAGLSGYPLLAIIALVLAGGVLTVSYVGMCRVLKVSEINDVVHLMGGRVPGLRRFSRSDH